MSTFEGPEDRPSDEGQAAPRVAHGQEHPAAGPAAGYYPDPSIPGFVRYWGGAAWVPGTARPAPAEGESLEPPWLGAREGLQRGVLGSPEALRAGRWSSFEAADEAGAQGPIYLDEASSGAFAVAFRDPGTALAHEVFTASVDDYFADGDDNSAGESLIRSIDEILPEPDAAAREEELAKLLKWLG
ncbi:DUF2510 domain-containing protein [Kitasatospora indigofera]|uniref:DUF2510 domain-containing protein n=1 Tax=Kitasatospora indigofera TaxID=67307 RepID=UPI0036C3E67A